VCGWFRMSRIFLYFLILDTENQFHIHRRLQRSLVEFKKGLFIRRRADCPLVPRSSCRRKSIRHIDLRSLSIPLQRHPLVPFIPPVDTGFIFLYAKSCALTFCRQSSRTRFMSPSDISERRTSIRISRLCNWPGCQATRKQIRSLVLCG
jgi:hypothetical protein